MADEFDYRQLLGMQRRNTLRFSTYIEDFLRHPQAHLKTSAGLISEAIRHFGVEIVVRAGEPALSYSVFKDESGNGVNAVYGQEFCIKHIVDVIDSIDKEAGPKRGIVLFGPPASGKTNICDLIAQALEAYTRETDLQTYSFFFRFANEAGRVVEIRSNFMHHPLLLYPIALQLDDGCIARPRQQLLEAVNDPARCFQRTHIPTFFQNASLDKRSLDIIEALGEHPRNVGKPLFDIIEEYVRVEEIQFVTAQAKGIANIDDMAHLVPRVKPMHLAEEDLSVLREHLGGQFIFQYEGAMVASNRGVLHIHDAFGTKGSNRPDETDYKPLLMLLGSGKISLESTQVPLDNTVIMTTNLEEIDMLDRQLTSTKLLDRIVRVPVNYLLDAVGETDILKRDLGNLRERYDIDPNLMRVAAYYSVMTRLLPPDNPELPPDWSEDKQALYHRITPEQKLMIYSCTSDDPMQTIRRLPHWHPFVNECLRVGINIFDSDHMQQHIAQHPEAFTLDETELFSDSDLQLIDDAFMRELRNEHYPNEGREGISIRQLQNLMQRTIANASANKVTADIFFAQLERVATEGASVHPWLATGGVDPDRAAISSRKIMGSKIAKGIGDYGDFAGLIEVTQALYRGRIRSEITMATVDRDPARIECDLRKYLQQVLLGSALENRAFAHILVPKYIYIDPDTGRKVERPDESFLRSIEKVIAPDASAGKLRQAIARRVLDAQDSGELRLLDGKTVISSRDDNVTHCFTKEYTALLSHRKAVDGVSPEHLRDAFFHYRNDPNRYARCSDEIRELVDQILGNMVNRFGYSKEIALDTIIHALRAGIIDFTRIIT